MAEGFAREYGKGLIEAYSAGLTPSRVHPRAIKVMQEIGFDISHQLSKAIDEALLKQMYIIITLCGHAEAMCPMTPPDIKRIHWPIDDPVGTIGSEEEIMKEFRRARDAIKKRVIKFFDEVSETL